VGTKVPNLTRSMTTLDFVRIVTAAAIAGYDAFTRR
jgi:hypothetical protein